MSTVEFQEATSSRAWQRAVCDELIDGVGSIVVEFFDEGVSRRWAWANRPEAAALLAAAESPHREFDAVVIGEYERAFYADQFRDVVTRLAAAGVAVWLPEAGGPVELDSPVHQALMVLLGAQAQREVARARHRVLAAMSAQARDQGRFLGGRPPYGYLLADAGPHPNPMHAAWGRQLHVLEPSPDTAPWVQWIFAQRAAHRSIASITRELNNLDVPCPSAQDRDRNRHRPATRWITRTVTAILTNPRYTGRQVWNRYATTSLSTHSTDSTSSDRGRGSGAGRWNPASNWIISVKPAHPALVDDTTFLAVQRINAATPTARPYRLSGLIVCQTCGRRMEAMWVHGHPAYRCRHGHTSGTPRPAGLRNTYCREDQILAALPRLIHDTLGLPPQPEADSGDTAASGQLIDLLRDRDLMITYSPAGPTLTATRQSVALTASQPPNRQRPTRPNATTECDLADAPRSMLIPG